MSTGGGSPSSPFVDIIIPAYNAARFLPAAIESVEAQTFTDWRILLIDDGSTDDTAAVVASYAERLGAKLKYIRQENRGLPAARNTAIRNSSAKLLALLDADDLWLPGRLAASVASFDSRPQAGVSYGLISWIDASGEITGTFQGNPAPVEGRVANDIYTRRMQLPCPSMTFRREAAERVGMFDETMRATEDRDLWLRIALHYEVAFVPEVIALYRLSSGTMSTDRERMMRAQRKFLDKHYGEPGCGFFARRRALARMYLQHAEVQARNGDRGASVEAILRVAAYAPFDMEIMRAAAALAVRGAR